MAALSVIPVQRLHVTALSITSFSNTSSELAERHFKKKAISPALCESLSIPQEQGIFSDCQFNYSERFLTALFYNVFLQRLFITLFTTLS